MLEETGVGLWLTVRSCIPTKVDHFHFINQEPQTNMQLLLKGLLSKVWANTRLLCLATRTQPQNLYTCLSWLGGVKGWQPIITLIHDLGDSILGTNSRNIWLTISLLGTNSSWCDEIWWFAYWKRWFSRATLDHQRVTTLSQVTTYPGTLASSAKHHERLVPQIRDGWF